MKQITEELNFYDHNVISRKILIKTSLTSKMLKEILVVRIVADELRWGCLIELPAIYG